MSPAASTTASRWVTMILAVAVGIVAIVGLTTITFAAVLVFGTAGLLLEFAALAVLTGVAFEWRRRQR
jgi:hypothetical protein